MTFKGTSVYNPLEGERPELNLDLTRNLTDPSSSEQVSIVIVHKDRPAHLNICLQSIAVCSVNHKYEIIVVDNSSEQDSQDFLEEIKDEVKVIKNDKNLYWSAAANKGAEAADKNSKYIVFMHNDVVITNPAWLDLLINVSESQKSGLVGVEMKSYYMAQRKIDFIQEWLVLFTKECFKECGPWPEKLPMIGPSFVLTLKAQSGGYKPQVMKNPIAHHYKIFSLNVNEWERLTEQAMVTIPQILKEIQSETLKRVI